MSSEKRRLASEQLRQLARDREDNTIPLVVLEERGAMDKSNQEHFYRIAEAYKFIQARTQWWCMNPECKVTLPDGRYYYKYKGSRDYWNYRRYGVWDRCCKLCYYDHILNPKTQEWKNRMSSILTTTMYEMERAMDRDNSPVRPRIR